MNRKAGSTLILMTGLLMCAVATRSHGQQPPKAGQKPMFDIQVLFVKQRIPKITVAVDGSVLAFAWDCKLYRRSTDGGKTWTEVQELGKVSDNVIVDENTSDVLIVSAANGFLLRSRDHGKTWKKEDITVKPNAAGHGAPGHLPVSGHGSETGISLRFGKHKGRLLMPVRICPPKGNNWQKYWPYHYNTSLYSDDKGKTWQTSAPVQSGTGEGTLAELSSGRLYYNSRSHLSVDHRRRIAWSKDGGEMWTDWEVSTELFEVGQPFYFRHGTKPSYGCNAGLVRVPDEVTGGKDLLLFSTLDNPGGNRIKMTVWASFDQGKTWPVKRLVFKGMGAYSSLAADKKGTLYLLYENGDKGLYDRISVARFNMEWLTGEPDWRKRFPK